MAEKYIIAHDMGTSGDKAILISVFGDIIDTVKQEYPIYHPHPGWAEENPLDWWIAVCESTRSVLDKTGINPSDIVGMTFTSHTQNLIPVDKNGDPLRPAMIWLDGRSAEAQGQEAVVGDGLSSPLEMPQGEGSGLHTAVLGDLGGKLVGEPAVSGFLTGFGLFHEGGFAPGGLRPLGGHHDGEFPAHIVSVPDLVVDLGEMVGNLRDENDVGGSGHAGEEGDPPGMAAHELDHEGSFVGFGGGVEPVDAFGCKMNRRIKAEGDHRFVKVVVDGFGNPHNMEPLFVQHMGNGQRTVPADGDQRIQPL